MVKSVHFNSQISKKQESRGDPLMDNISLHLVNMGGGIK